MKVQVSKPPHFGVFSSCFDLASGIIEAFL